MLSTIKSVPSERSERSTKHYLNFIIRRTEKKWKIKIQRQTNKQEKQQKKQTSKTTARSLPHARNTQWKCWNIDWLSNSPISYIFRITECIRKSWRWEIRVPCLAIASTSAVVMQIMQRASGRYQAIDKAINHSW